MLVIAAGALAGAMSRGSRGQSTLALKDEVLKDLELFRQWKGTL